MSGAAVTPSWITVFGNDLFSFLLCVLLLAAYHVFMVYKVRKDPTYTVQAINAVARAAWVETMMAQGKPDVIPVQTLRNSTMAATFLASTAVLLTIGVLTLSSQGDRLTSISSWHALNPFGAKQSGLWMGKLMLLLMDLFVAFFSFTQSIRMYNHVGYMINVPPSPNYKAISPRNVAFHLNTAGNYYSIGMRAFYFTVPLVFWLFGPHFMVASAFLLIAVLYKIDRPSMLMKGEDHGG